MILLVLLGCGPSPRTWPSIDEAALRARLDSPTATSPEPQAVVEELMDVLQAGSDLESIPDALDAVLAESDAESPSSPSSDDDEVVSGTSAFFEVACPGTTGTPDPDFARGVVRLEGPFLIEDGSLPVLGPIFLTFGACELGSTVVDGEMRARWIADDERLLAIGIIDVLVREVQSWDAAFSIDQGALALSYTLPRGTVTLTFATEQVRADFADGSFFCSRTEPVTCDGIE